MSNAPFLVTEPESAVLPLPEDEVHVWRACLDVTEVEFWLLAATLSADELARGRRFRSFADSGRFVVARAVLRDILARYLDAAPAELSFAEGASGKPFLAAPAAPWLRFNVSHSENLAVYAIARHREVGVDLEKVRPELAQPGIAQHFFSKGERSALKEATGSVYADAFFACWTRKEAYVKARGDGLSSRLDEFEVNVAPDMPAELLRGDHQWSLRSLPVADGFAAACAVKGHSWRLRLWNWPGQSACLQSLAA